MQQAFTRRAGFVFHAVNFSHLIIFLLLLFFVTSTFPHRATITRQISVFLPDEVDFSQLSHHEWRHQPITL